MSNLIGGGASSLHENLKIKKLENTVKFYSGVFEFTQGYCRIGYEDIGFSNSPKAIIVQPEYNRVVNTNFYTTQISSAMAYIYAVTKDGDIFEGTDRLNLIFIY